MPEHLVFTLAAQLGAMGDLAGHERRGSLTWPGRSAVLGLLGAALGLRREDDFSALDTLLVAVAVFEPGQPLRDYHTVQTVPTAAARRPQSRPEALLRGEGSLNTTITLRDYRAGVLFGVALCGETPAAELALLRDALERPAFHLYLGRKSCPLSAPVAPRLVQADDAAAALAQLVLPPWHRGAVAHVLHADPRMMSGPPQRVETRHDQTLDRRKWHFAAREVQVHQVEIRPGEAA